MTPGRVRPHAGAGARRAAADADTPLGAIPWPRIRVVVFDVDGTLYDQRPLRRRMWLALIAHCLARPGDLAVLRTLRLFRRLREELAEEASEGIGRLQYERPASLLGLSPEAVQLAVETWMHQRPLPLLRRCRYPGVERVFEALAASGRTIAIFSDYPAGAKLKALGLRADFEVCATDADVQRLKPHPLGLQRVLERTGAGPEECLYIGDRDERDGACARRLGVAYLHKAATPGTGLPGAFHHFDELLPWLSDPPLGRPAASISDPDGSAPGAAR
jgi:HAD superfamily hydrolase (TIGR01549 family)